MNKVHLAPGETDLDSLPRMKVGEVKLLEKVFT